MTFAVFMYGCMYFFSLWIRVYANTEYTLVATI